jgi:Protein of unknown function (DUF4235)
MKILYKPFGIIAGIVSAQLGRRAFKRLWSRIDDSAPPKPTTAQAGIGKVIGAATLEAATMAGVAAAVDRASAKSFHYLTGIWPGDKRPKKPEDA